MVRLAEDHLQWLAAFFCQGRTIIKFWGKANSAALVLSDFYFHSAPLGLHFFKTTVEPVAGGFKDPKAKCAGVGENQFFNLSQFKFIKQKA